jgi:hypothetical protein
MIDTTLIKCVLGFNLNMEVLDMEGEVIKTGISRTVYPKTYREHVNIKLINKRWFNSFDEDLLAKIRDYKQVNT